MGSLHVPLGFTAGLLTFVGGIRPLRSALAASWSSFQA